MPARAFWRTGAGPRTPEQMEHLSDCRARLTPDAVVATAGSCFAQHISRRLRRMGFNFLDAEPPPPWMNAAAQRDFGYGIFSARYGNIYTSRQLKQLLLETLGTFVPAERVWETDGRFYDPFRPSVEPQGFESAAEVLLARDTLLRGVRRILKTADVFVFTLGLTECWRSREDGAVYPTCPGTQAGAFDARRHEFVNLTYGEILADMRDVIRLLRRRRPAMRFILTVSPVPLTATASGRHVLTATTHSKAILRAVAGQLTDEFDFVDYFPSYELITAPSFGGRFYAANKREVTDEGVSVVMDLFQREFCAAPAEARPATPAPHPNPAGEAGADAICDEMVLDFYARR
ncbi:MAG: GSCFA domain-containing protein [Alphaproteobacteria bacterium]|nr:GSCFA domain-containing protein [Alphaproteobacteria bacterium]